MQIFVLRHGQAEPQQTTDEARNLTVKGRSNVAEIIENSLSELTSIQEIWSSSFIRAQQTAQVVHDILFAQGIERVIKTTDLITPESNPSGLFEHLQVANLNCVLLASHQPFVGDFLDIFCGSAARGRHAMNTSSLALVECDIVAAGCGALRWLKHING